MMYLKNEDLDILIEAENKLGNWEDNWKLWNLIERLTKQRDKDRERIKNIVAERRKLNKDYARSKKGTKQ